jgi:hypothetical protein
MARSNFYAILAPLNNDVVVLRPNPSAFPQSSSQTLRLIPFIVIYPHPRHKFQPNTQALMYNPLAILKPSFQIYRSRWRISILLWTKFIQDIAVPISCSYCPGIYRSLPSLDPLLFQPKSGLTTTSIDSTRRSPHLWPFHPRRMISMTLSRSPTSPFQPELCHLHGPFSVHPFLSAL